MAAGYAVRTPRKYTRATQPTPRAVDDTVGFAGGGRRERAEAVAQVAAEEAALEPYLVTETFDAAPFGMFLRPAQRHANVGAVVNSIHSPESELGKVAQPLDRVVLWNGVDVQFLAFDEVRRVAKAALDKLTATPAKGRQRKVTRRSSGKRSIPMVTPSRVGIGHGRATRASTSASVRLSRSCWIVLCVTGQRAARRHLVATPLPLTTRRL